MALTIFKIIFIVLLIRSIILIASECFAIFNKNCNDEIVKKVNENPSKFVRDVFLDKIIDNFIWAGLFIMLLISAFKGNVTIH